MSTAMNGPLGRLLTGGRADPGAPGQTRTLSSHTATPRSCPKGTRLIKATSDEAILQFKAVVRFWWLMPPFLLGFTLLGAAPVGGALGYLASTWQNDHTFSGAVIMVILSAVATVWSFFATRLWVTVIAHPTRLKAGNRTYDRGHYGGMRIGYEIRDGSDVLKNDFHDLSLGLQGLRLVYGPWGEDLPYLVNKYHASEIVIWMNSIIDAVGEPDSRKTAPEIGRREQAF